MKKLLKIFLLLLLLAALVLISTVSYAQTVLNRYDPAQEGIVSEYLHIDYENGLITGIAPGTTLEQLNKLVLPGDLTADTEEIGTGTVLTSAKAGQSLTAIVNGDVNGDAGISITDMMMIKSHILGIQMLDKAMLAGDLNGDGSISVTDFMGVKSNLLGLSTISFSRNAGAQPLILAPNATQPWDKTGVTYVSGNEDLVKIGADGMLTAQNVEGTAFVYALDENGAVLARTAVSVLDGGLQVKLDKTGYGVCINQSVTLSAVLNHPVNTTYTWQTDDSSICTVSADGVLTGHAYGDTVVRVTLPNGMQAQAPVKVMPPITAMELSAKLYKVKPGATKQLLLQTTPAESGEEIIWTSGNTEIVTVDDNGVVTGVKKGTTTVTATGKYSGLKVTCDVKVCDVIQVAITFDDGPSKHTPKLLDYLKESGIKATFFIVCNRINSFKGTTQRIVDEGHELGYHSWSHKNQKKLTTDQIKSDFKKSCGIVEDLTGATFTVWRAPGGSINTRVLDAIDLPHIMWSVDTLDWKYRNVDHVYNAILKNADDGEIILLHDLHKTSVEGAIKAMKVMQAGDYEFLTVTELLSRNGTAPSNNKNYSKVK